MRWCRRRAAATTLPVGYDPGVNTRWGRLTATTTLARAIDRTERDLVVGMADTMRRGGVAGVGVWPVGGGTAVLCEPGAPFNKVAAVGLDGVSDGAAAGDGNDPIDTAVWATIEAVHAQRGIPVQVELSTLADPAVASALTARGYRLAGFENILGLAIGDGAPDLPTAPAGIEVSVVRGAIAEDVADAVSAGNAPRQAVPGWGRILTTGFQHPDVIDGPASHESFDQAALERTFAFFAGVPGVTRVIATIAGEPAGGASMFMHNDVALLCGAATLPAFRRRGVQSALLLWRLAMARNADCRIAVVTTQPGSKSQQNVQQLGFDLLYSRAILVKMPEPA